jgi:hypothetical protein
MLLGFKPRFESKILDKSKRHTIRPKRKKRPRPGQPCHCYVNPRQKTMRLLGRWYCVRVQDIWIKVARFGPKGPAIGYAILVDGDRLKADEREALAIADGFENFGEMMEFWSGRLPFHGDIIHWNPGAPAPPPKRALGILRNRKSPKECTPR